MTIVSEALAAAKKSGQRFRPKRPVAQQYPITIERAYVSAVVRLQKAMAKDILGAFLPKLKGMVDAVDTEDHADVADVEATIKTIVGELDVKLSNKHLRKLTALVEEYKQRINAVSDKLTKRQLDRMFAGLRRQIRKTIILDAMAPSKELDKALDAWRKEGVDLITKMGEEQLDDAARTVRAGVQAGDRPDLIAKRLRARLGVGESRARLIARDQTNKLNGKLTQIRQESLGIEKYIWRTSRDERVRPTHLANEGKEFRWDKPPKETGHPGHDVNCRCSSAPVIPGLPKQKDTPQSAARLKKLKKAVRDKEKAKAERKKARAAKKRKTKT